MTATVTEKPSSRLFNYFKGKPSELGAVAKILGYPEPLIRTYSMGLFNSPSLDQRVLEFLQQGETPNVTTKVQNTEPREKKARSAGVLDLPKRVAYYLEDMAFTQKYFAKATGTAPFQISRLVLGQSVPTNVEQAVVDYFKTHDPFEGLRKEVQAYLDTRGLFKTSVGKEMGLGHSVLGDFLDGKAVVWDTERKIRDYMASRTPEAFVAKPVAVAPAPAPAPAPVPRNDRPKRNEKADPVANEEVRQALRKFLEETGETVYSIWKNGDFRLGSHQRINEFLRGERLFWEVNLQKIRGYMDNYKPAPIPEVKLNELSEAYWKVGSPISEVVVEVKAPVEQETPEPRVMDLESEIVRLHDVVGKFHNLLAKQSLELEVLKKENKNLRADMAALRVDVGRVSSKVFQGEEPAPKPSFFRRLFGGS